MLYEKTYCKFNEIYLYPYILVYDFKDTFQVIQLASWRWIRRNGVPNRVH